MTTPPQYPYSGSDYPAQPPPPGPTPVRVAMPKVNPVVTYTLIAVTVLVYGAQVISQQLLQGGDLPFYYAGKINQFILQGELWRLITPIFLHGSIYHIGFNMYALYILGRGLERAYGHTRFAALYFLAGFAGNVASFLLSSSPSLGASTAVFGLVAAQGVFIYQNRKLFGPQSTRSSLSNIAFIIVLNLGLGISPGSNIDNWGHLGGLIGGLIFSWLGGPLWKVEGIGPLYQVADQRQTGQVQLAALGVLLVFGALTVLGFVLQG
jgi:rhomboid protease GluP